MSQCRYLIFNSLNSFLEEAEKEKEAEKPDIPKISQTAKSAGENEALGKETVDKTEKDSSSKEEKAVSEETNAPLSKTVLIEGIEIDIDELLKRDDDEDQYWVCSYDCRLFFSTLLWWRVQLVTTGSLSFGAQKLEFFPQSPSVFSKTLEF